MSLEIILYDSSPVTQKIFSHILYPYAPNVYHTNKAAELLDKIQYNKPDIIFMDYPASQALEQKTLKNINTKIHSQNIPMILITSNDSPTGDPQNSSAQDVLSKPIEATRLTALVNRFVPKTKTNILTQHLQFQQFPLAEQTTQQLEQVEQIEQENRQVDLDLSQQAEQVAQAGPIAQLTAHPAQTKNKENKKIDLEPPVNQNEAEFQNDANAPPKTNITSKPVPVDEDTLPLDIVPIENKPSETVADDANNTEALENKKDIKEIFLQELKQPENSESKIELFKEKEVNTVDQPVPSEQTKKTTKTEMEAAIKKIIDTNIETTLKNSIQEILPELAAKIIKEELNKLLNEDEDES